MDRVFALHTVLWIDADSCMGPAVVRKHVILAQTNTDIMLLMEADTKYGVMETQAGRTCAVGKLHHHTYSALHETWP